MPRFIAVVSGSGIHAIKDTLSGHLVCGFFLNKDNPESTMTMIKICLDALNREHERRISRG